jgi:hypothetical protein
LQKENVAEKTQPLHLHINSGKLDLSGPQRGLWSVTFTTREMQVMKRLFYVASAGLLFVSLAGCNRGWPSLFCNNNDDACCEVVEGGECCESSGYYGASSPAVQYVPAPAPTKVDELPMPGPDNSRT